MELSEEQQQFILENWDKTEFIALVQQVFEKPELDGRSVEAKVVRKFLGDRKIKKKGEIKPAPSIILTDEQKEYVRNSLENLTPHEIAKILFNNPKIDPLSKEVSAVAAYAKSLSREKQFPHEEYAKEDYSPPDQLSAIVAKVNKLLGKEINHKTMPAVQRKSMEAVRNFLNAPRFIHTINSYVSQKTRDLFEKEFIRTVADKPDLTPDELNIAITLCQHYVMGITLHRQLDMLNIKYEETLNDPDGKLTVPLAEMVKAKSAELEKVNKAQTDLTKFLSGERSKRQERQGSQNVSMASLVEWFRNKEERDQALKRAELQAMEDEEEVKRLEEVKDTKARIMGISKSELLYG